MKKLLATMITTLMFVFSTGYSMAYTFDLEADTSSHSSAITQGGTISAGYGEAVTESGVRSVSGGNAGVFMTPGGMHTYQNTYTGSTGGSGTYSWGNAIGTSVYGGNAHSGSGAGKFVFTY